MCLVSTSLQSVVSMVGMPECDRSQGPMQLKKPERKHKTSGALLTWFLPGENILLPPGGSLGMQGWAGLLIWPPRGA